jgi:hypothetical protein
MIASLASPGQEPARARWFRFLWAARVVWDQAARSDARDFCRWLQLAGKPARPHWRERDRPGPAASDSLEYTQAKTHLIQRLLGN